MRTVAIIVALALGGGASGCAFIASRSPGPVRLPDRPDCRAGKGAVVVDGVVAGFTGLTALAAASDDAGEVGAVFGVISALYIASAVAGNSSANRCQAANEEFDLLAAEHNRSLEARELQARREAAMRAATPPVVAPGPARVVDPSAGGKPPPASGKPAPTLSMRSPGTAAATPAMTPAVTPPATGAPRPPAEPPPDAGDEGDEGAGADEGDEADEPDDEPSPGVGRWRDFWREVTP